MYTLGKGIPRIEAPDKVTGSIKYNNDYSMPGLLYAKMVISTCAHGKIKALDLTEAWKVSGVKAILLGKDYPKLHGQVLEDRPIMAVDKVRYYGEPLALVVANSEAEAGRAASLVKVEYESLPVVNSVSEALKPKAPLIHENLGSYIPFLEGVYPEPGSNVGHRVKIRKGDMNQGWSQSSIVVEASFNLPQSDHAAMETRSALAEIKQDGRVIIHSTSQGPFMIKKMISSFFQVEEGKVIVHTPYTNLRDFINNKEYLTLEVQEPGILLDMDTMEDYKLAQLMVNC